MAHFRWGKELSSDVLLSSLWLHVTVTVFHLSVIRLHYCIIVCTTLDV